MPHHGDHLHRRADGRVYDRDGTEGADALIRDEPADLLPGIHRLQGLGEPDHLPSPLADDAAGQLRTAQGPGISPEISHFLAVLALINYVDSRQV